MFSKDVGAWEDCLARNLIPKDLSSIEEGILIDADGERLRGVAILTCPLESPATWTRF
jgi:hypothetical protein